MYVSHFAYPFTCEGTSVASTFWLCEYCCPEHMGIKYLFETLLSALLDEQTQKWNCWVCCCPV